jgi:hypothetical protein
MTELIGSRHGIADGVKSVQRYDRDDGDFSLLDDQAGVRPGRSARPGR